jgi:hypothetical protein
LEQSPLDVFSLLLLGHGYGLGEFDNVARAAWEELLGLHPFRLVRYIDQARSAFSAWYDDADPALPLRRDASAPFAFQIDRAKADAVAYYLANKEVRYDAGGGTDVSAARIWASQGRSGRNGCLVAVLVNEATPGELYQVYASPSYPVPMVAVAVTGKHWARVLVRAVAQVLGGLFDEYALPGAEHDIAPEGIDQAANLLFITSSERARLAVGEDPGAVLGEVPAQWKNNRFLFKPRFYKEGDPPPKYRSESDVDYFEGGGGYRRNVLRSDYDCLMRREPNSTSAPIQDEIEFCCVCRRILEFALRGDRDYKLISGRRVLLDTQRLHYDDIAWGQTMSIKGPILNSYFTRFVDSGTSGPNWSCDIAVNDSIGLSIANLQLSNRPGDMFTAAKDVLKEISFQDLAILTNQSIPLPVNLAFANTLDPPVLEVSRDGDPRPGTGAEAAPDFEYKFGVKLALSWDLPGNWAVDAAMTLVLRGMKNDFDPGGAAMACKFYPELSLRYRRPSPGAAARLDRLPEVEALRGTVAVVANNVIAPSLVGPPPSGDEFDQHMHEHFHHMATGKLNIALMTDSNSSDDDSEYIFSGDVLRIKIPISLVPVPTVPLVWATWKRGRKLAGLVRRAEPLKQGGVFARMFHLMTFRTPGLPHWSWLFDYGIPTVVGTKPKVFVAAYHQGEAKGRAFRETAYQWPPVPADAREKPMMTVRKVPRQGAFDNVHVNAAMGIDQQGRPVVAAPFCADLCLHLHWRWGVVATAPGEYPYPFLGWGNGSGNQGKNTIRGGMLIPPNQHLEVEVTNQADAEAHIRYIVTADRPRVGALQIILEQGFGFAFSYDGIAIERPDRLGLLALGLNLILDSTFESVAAGVTDRRSRQYELAVRNFFDRIYATIRWYDPDIDGANVQQFPGDPGQSTDPKQPVYPAPPKTLEDL